MGSGDVSILFTALVVSTLLCAVSCRADISFGQFTADLLCTARSSGVPLAESGVGSAYNITCDDARSTYSRVRFDATISSDTDGARAIFSHEVMAVPTFGSASGDASVHDVSGCVDRAPHEARAPDCYKVELPLRTSNNSLHLADEDDLVELLGISAEDARVAVQGLNITFEIGHVRWAYDLEPLPSTVIPFDYDVRINTTAAAYEQAERAADADGLITKLARCYPALSTESARIGGTIDACYRAACNCSGFVDKSADVPDLYTYELQWVQPGCHLRRVRNGGRPRLTADVRVDIEAIVKLRGEVLFRGALVSQSIDDVTAGLSTSTGLGDLWTGSGVQDISQRAYSATGPFSFPIGSARAGSTLPPVHIGSKRFAAAAASTLLKFRAHLNRTFAGFGTARAPTHDLAGDATRAASVAHFDLGGGYVVDCLNDHEVGTNPYRNSATNPYNVHGLPADGLPPDRWLFLSDAASRRGALFNTHLRESCGLLGTSSAAIALGGSVLNSTLCCDGSLINGACAPGSAHDNAFPSPARILANGSLWRASFTPRGFRQFNYYLLGRNKLYAQPTTTSISGMSPLLNSAVNGVFNMTLELSDLLLRPRQSLGGSHALIPPLRFAEEPDADKRVFASAAQETVSCAYNTDGSGTGVIAIQKLCNVGSSGASANVSLVFRGCGQMRFYSESGKLLNDFTLHLDNLPALRPGRCLDAFTVPVFVPRAHNVTQPTALALDPMPQCDAVVASATSGSTVEATVHNVTCAPLRRTWNAPIAVTDSVVRKWEQDPECSYCSDLDFDCIRHCKSPWSTPAMLFIFWIPVVFAGGLLLVFLISFFVISAQMRTPLAFSNNFSHQKQHSATI